MKIKNYLMFSVLPSEFYGFQNNDKLKAWAFSSIKNEGLKTCKPFIFNWSE